ncbi:protein PFF0380w-like [Centruroides sculpturatus]|uniref:protein PFF0380w-like n=1 Tax=Centruroides sculpturatus TaxID=218467 RepID=UPI000C6E29B0|nr:protein PFF0380w-like [Centruroides sculpturatus]
MKTKTEMSTENKPDILSDNYFAIKGKIISTDTIIKNYSVKCEENEAQKQKLENLTLMVEKLRQECTNYENNLSKSLQEIEPLKTNWCLLKEENAKQVERVEALQTKLNASEKLMEQYDALLKNMNEDSSDTNNKNIVLLEKEVERKEKTIENIREKIEQEKTSKKKLHERYKKTLMYLLKFGEELQKRGMLKKKDKNIIDIYSKGSFTPDDVELDDLDICVSPDMMELEDLVCEVDGIQNDNATDSSDLNGSRENDDIKEGVEDTDEVNNCDNAQNEENVSHNSNDEDCKTNSTKDAKESKNSGPLVQKESNKEHSHKENVSCNSNDEDCKTNLTKNAKESKNSGPLVQKESNKEHSRKENVSCNSNDEDCKTNSTKNAKESKNSGPLIQKESNKEHSRKENFLHNLNFQNCKKSSQESYKGSNKYASSNQNETKSEYSNDSNIQKVKTTPPDIDKRCDKYITANQNENDSNHLHNSNIQTCKNTSLENNIGVNNCNLLKQSKINSGDSVVKKVKITTSENTNKFAKCIPANQNEIYPGCSHNSKIQKYNTTKLESNKESDKCISMNKNEINLSDEESVSCNSNQDCKTTLAENDEVSNQCNAVTIDNKINPECSHKDKILHNSLTETCETVSLESNKKCTSPIQNESESEYLNGDDISHDFNIQDCTTIPSENNEKSSKCFNPVQNEIDSEISYKEMEDEIIKILAHMKCQTECYQILSPIPSTPETFDITNKRTENRKKKKRKFEKLKNNDDEETNQSKMNEHFENVNGERRVTFADEFPNSNGNLHSFQQDDSTDSRYCDKQNHDDDNLKESSQNLQECPFKANFSHCPIDGNFKINIRLLDDANNTTIENHKMTTINIGFNNLTKEFSIGYSKVPCVDHKSDRIENNHIHSYCNNNCSIRDEKVNKVQKLQNYNQNNQQKNKNFSRVPKKNTFDKNVSDISNNTFQENFNVSNSTSSRKNLQKEVPLKDHVDSLNKSSNFTSDSEIEQHEILQENYEEIDDLITRNSSCNITSQNNKINKFQTINNLKLDSTESQKCLNFGKNSDKNFKGRENVNGCQTKIHKRTETKLKNVSLRSRILSGLKSNRCIKSCSLSVSSSKKINSKTTDITSVKQNKIAGVEIDTRSEATECKSSKIKCPVNLSTSQNNTSSVTSVLEESNYSNIHKLVNNKLTVNNEKSKLTQKRILRNNNNDLDVTESKRQKLDNINKNDTVACDYWTIGSSWLDIDVHANQLLLEIGSLNTNSANCKDKILKIYYQLLNPKVITSADVFIKSLLIYLSKTRKNAFIDFIEGNCSPPLLTNMERNLILFITFLEKKSKNHLKHIAQSLQTALLAHVFTKNHHILFGLATLCRLYVGLCKQKGELEKARVFCYDLFIKFKESSIYLVSTVVGVWPTVLTGKANSPLEKVYAYILFRAGNNLNSTLYQQCKSVLELKCKLKSPNNEDILSLGKEIICTIEEQTINENVKQIFLEAQMALELLAIYSRDKSILEQFFKLLLSEFEKYQKNFNNDISQTKLVFITKMLGTVSLRCNLGKNNVDIVEKKLFDLLDSSASATIIQESAFVSLVLLQPKLKQSCIDIISKWFLSHQSELSNEVKNFIEKLKLKDFFKS